ncbi:signal peptidase II [Nocardioides sp. GXZ039]|uniref:signal peptidase II n=1 Tax=Nocardioides sp. GXZ039 TaxID=3136018 RepID=UPI0030F37FEF
MQAARGTPVDPDATEAPRTGRRFRLTFLAVALTAYVVDVVTKIVAVERLDGRPDVEVVGDLLQLTLVRNPGAAFSTGTNLTPVISVVAIIATCVVLWFARRVGTTLWAVALGFLFAGITGNLTDRMLRDPSPFHGHVIDFLKLPNWPVFNVADICINIAAALIIIQAIRGVRLDGTREDRGGEPADDDVDLAESENTDAERPTAPAEEGEDTHD